MLFVTFYVVAVVATLVSVAVVAVLDAREHGALRQRHRSAQILLEARTHRAALQEEAELMEVLTAADRRA